MYTIMYIIDGKQWYLKNTLKKLSAFPTACLATVFVPKSNFSKNVDNNNT